MHDASVHWFVYLFLGFSWRFDHRILSQTGAEKGISSLTIKVDSFWNACFYFVGIDLATRRWTTFLSLKGPKKPNLV
jgi:hypothetical protein